MPRVSQRVAEPVFRSVFEQVTEVIRAAKGTDLVKLHMGDTHVDAPEPARPEALHHREQPSYNCYANTRGNGGLRQLLLEKLAQKNGLPGLEPHHLQVTCGAIHGLFAAFRALLAPGESVLTLAPHWHLIGGVIQEAGGVPVDVDFYLPIAEGKPIREILQAALRPDTAAIYLNSPNNPTGVVLDRSQIEELAAFAVEHDLWVVSDEAYEDFIFCDTEHCSIASLPGLFERTVSVYTFSKNMAAAGYRIGYTVAGPALTERLHACSSRTVYNAPSNNQLSVVQALQAWEQWFPGLYGRYAELRAIVRDTLRAPCRLPDSGFYAFVDANAACERLGGPIKVLQAMAAEGVACVPGAAFGEGYETWFRLCYVSEHPKRLAVGLERLDRVLLGESS